MSKYKRNFLSMFFVASLILLQGCSSSGPKALTYDQYRGLYQAIYDQYVPEGFQREPSPETLDLVAVDKESSFGKRTYLTLTGEQTNQSTQDTITFKDNKSNVLYMTIIYLNRSIGNDLIYMNVPSQNLKKDDVANNFDDDIISYNNVLIKNTLFTKGDQKAVDTSIMKNTTKSLVEFLKKYTY